jgi:hypothetical protein
VAQAPMAFREPVWFYAQGFPVWFNEFCLFHLKLLNTLR